MSNQLAFVINAFRYVDDTNESVRAKFTDNARIITIETYLDEPGAIRRIAEELTAGDTTRVFEIDVEQLFLPDDFLTAPPRFAVYSPADNLDGDVFTAFEVTAVDLLTGVSTVRMR